jgi:hypothetical protein
MVSGQAEKVNLEAGKTRMVYIPKIDFLKLKTASVLGKQ